MNTHGTETRVHLTHAFATSPPPRCPTNQNPILVPLSPSLSLYQITHKGSNIISISPLNWDPPRYKSHTTTSPQLRMPHADTVRPIPSTILIPPIWYPFSSPSCPYQTPDAFRFGPHPPRPPRTPCGARCNQEGLTPSRHTRRHDAPSRWHTHKWHVADVGNHCPQYAPSSPSTRPTITPQSL